MVNRPPRPQPKTRAARTRAVRAALAGALDPSSDAAADGPVSPCIEAGPQTAAAANARNGPIDIERADGPAVGSIEAVTGDALEDGVAGFEEPVGEGRDNGPSTRDG
jgi:hypothetical protein